MKNRIGERWVIVHNSFIADILSLTKKHLFTNFILTYIRSLFRGERQGQSWLSNKVGKKNWEWLIWRHGKRLLFQRCNGEIHFSGWDNAEEFPFIRYWQTVVLKTSHYKEQTRFTGCSPNARPYTKHLRGLSFLTCMTVPWGRNYNYPHLTQEEVRFSEVKSFTKLTYLVDDGAWIRSQAGSEATLT